MEEKVKIKIPKADEKEVVKFTKGNFGDIKKKFERIDQILFGVMLAVVLSVIAIIVSVIGLFLDQMRYNNAAYREYSENIKAVDSNRSINNELLEQNKQNQELILDQQRQILEIINK